MKKGSSYESYPLYLKVTAMAIFIGSSLWGLLLYFLWPGLSAVHVVFAWIVEGILLAIPVYGITMWCVMGLAASGRIEFSPVWMRLSNRTLYALFPMLLVVGKLGGLEKDRLMQSFIALINHLVGLHLYVVPPERLLLLTPHCLQQTSCVHKVTSDVHNCKQCGGCQVGELLSISEELGCHFVVVTGGTLARLKVKEYRPKAIVAIACERDLVSGMNDVFPIPVFGILNERPCGPCCNTRVDTQQVRHFLQGLIDGKNGKC